MEKTFNYTAQEFFFDESFSDYPEREKTWEELLSEWINKLDAAEERFIFTLNEDQMNQHFADVASFAQKFARPFVMPIDVSRSKAPLHRSVAEHMLAAVTFNKRKL